MTYRRTKNGIIKLRHSQARVDDMSTGKRHYFSTYEAASQYAQTQADAARASGDQHYDRFYVWCDGECYSYEGRA